MLLSTAHSAKEEFEKFLLSLDAPTNNNFMQVDFLKSRVDQFLRAHFKDKTACWIICKLIFTPSHNQCAVERGFCINKEILIENLQGKSIVWQKVVYDHLQASKVDLHKYPIGSDLLRSCKSTRQRYSIHLQEQRIKVKVDQKSNKRKLVMDEVNDVKEHQKRLTSSIASLNVDIEKFCYQP